MMNNRESAISIFLAGIRGVMPDRIIGDLVSLRGDTLKVGYQEYNLRKPGNLWIIGAGKASAAMAHYMESIIGDRVNGGHVITKYGCYCKLKKIKVTEAGHPVPDENSFNATSDIIRIADEAGENDLVICLWSGGGSALLADYPETSSVEEIKSLNEILVNSGADIREMNSVRKHFSRVKGGQLARHIYPAGFINIILSDVIGDHFDVIASGPSVPDNSTFADALAVIKKYNLAGQVPSGLLLYLNQGTNGMRPETPKADDPVFAKSISLLAGSNKSALQAARAEAEKMGFPVYIITDKLNGDTNDACSFVINTINDYRSNTSLTKPLCLLFGGETTVKVAGDGSGGRNQHLALASALRLQNIPGVTLLSAGTDGNDGNTDMAGSVVDSETLHDALSMNIDPEKYFNNFDSYNFFRNAGGHVFTGPTLTNVMDIVIVIIE
jgi:glycerate 2-kinase